MTTWCVSRMATGRCNAPATASRSPSPWVVAASCSSTACRSRSAARRNPATSSLVQPTATAVAGLDVLITDNSRVAAAAPIRTAGAAANAGTSRYLGR